MGKPLARATDRGDDPSQGATRAPTHGPGPGGAHRRWHSRSRRADPSPLCGLRRREVTRLTLAAAARLAQSLRIKFDPIDPHSVYPAALVRGQNVPRFLVFLIFVVVTTAILGTGFYSMMRAHDCVPKPGCCEQAKGACGDGLACLAPNTSRDPSAAAATVDLLLIPPPTSSMVFWVSFAAPVAPVSPLPAHHRKAPRLRPRCIRGPLGLKQEMSRRALAAGIKATMACALQTLWSVARRPQGRSSNNAICHSECNRNWVMMSTASFMISSMGVGMVVLLRNNRMHEEDKDLCDHLVTFVCGQGDFCAPDTVSYR